MDLSKNRWPHVDEILLGNIEVRDNLLLRIGQSSHTAELWNEVDGLIISTVDITARGAGNKQKLRIVAHINFVALLVVLNVSNVAILLSKVEGGHRVHSEIDIINTVCLLVVVCHDNLSLELCLNLRL